MKDNREIGFDILENSDINDLEKIGADNMMIDKSARDRMLKITNKKYKEEKEMLYKEQIIGNISENEDAVTGVENYNRKGISRIIYTALSSAAVLAIVCGSIYMLGRNKGVSPYTPEPLEKATTTIVSETTVNTTATATGTATATKNTATTKTSVTDTTTANATSAENTTAAINNETPANNTAVSATDIDPKWISKYDSIDPTEITQEKLNAAFERAMDRFMNEKNFYGYGTKYKADEIQVNLVPIWDIKADMRDINGDSVPELFISYDMRGESLARTIMFIYDGNDFIAPTVKGCVTDAETLLYIDAAWMTYNQEDKCLYLEDKSGYNFTRKIKFDSDNSFTNVAQFNYQGYYEYGEFVNTYDKYIGNGNPIYNSGKLGDLPGDRMNAETFYAEKNHNAEIVEQNPDEYPYY
ncbi:hypothetical protein [Ruminococcus sp.]|uniref:hypothetical protein n=1 Tax=Ruminococcus sp. TaxID=41978 RepID=UPI0025E25556|nr:hypothetical protein [Ruminococcus sp.]